MAKKAGKSGNLKAAASNRQNKIAMIAITLVVCVLLVALVMQGNTLREKIRQNARRQEQVEQQLSQEEARTKEIEDLQEYVKSDEYMEKVAKEKAGLLKPNEIIFKEEN